LGTTTQYKTITASISGKKESDVNDIRYAFLDAVDFRLNQVEQVTHVVQLIQISQFEFYREVIFNFGNDNHVGERVPTFNVFS
jgi:hypothetical protein